MSSHCINEVRLSRPAVLHIRGDFAPRRRRTLMAGIALVHMAGIGLWLQMDAVRRGVVEIAPIMVRLVAAPWPAPPTTPLPVAQRALPDRVTPQSVVPTTPVAAPVPSAPAVTVSAEFSAAAPLPVAAASPLASPVPQPLALPAPPPAARRVISAKAVRYLLEPPVEVPRLSQRAGEHGVVWLRVVVGVQGQPLQVDLFRSSGYSRLDEQALWAMRRARFTPHTEDGRPIEVEVIAPIEYPAS
jgi:periplasmic protein TonB